MNKIAYFLFPLIIIFTSLHAVPNYPFPTHNTYFQGNGQYPAPIKPSNVSQTSMDQKVQTLWTQWKQEYLVTVPDEPDQMYVFYNEDGESDPENAVSVSEGHGYGMMLAAYMAGYDSQAQVIFDNLFRFYQAFQSVITPSLMGWQQVDEDGEIVPEPEGGDDSATDGDFDIAFALLLADKQWGSNGEINYLAFANDMIYNILEADINQQKFSIKLGDWVEDKDATYGKATRTSDFILNHLKNFAAAVPDPRWELVISKTYAIINELYTNFGPATGLLPDFAEFIGGMYVPADEDFLENDTDGFYSWNACRTPWRIATDYILTGDPRAYTQLTTLNSWIQSSTGGSPYDTSAGYMLDGTPLEDYDDLAFVTSFAVGAIINPSNQTWLNSLWSYTSTQPTSNESYFANTVRLLCFVIISGNWWTPLNLPY